MRETAHPADRRARRPTGSNLRRGRERRHALLAVGRVVRGPELSLPACCGGPRDAGSGIGPSSFALKGQTQRTHVRAAASRSATACRPGGRTRPPTPTRRRRSRRGESTFLEAAAFTSSMIVRLYRWRTIRAGMKASASLPSGPQLPWPELGTGPRSSFAYRPSLRTAPAPVRSASWRVGSCGNSACRRQADKRGPGVGT
jgi:hypothetical protein